MGSSAKTGKFFFEGHWSTFLHENAIWDRTPPSYTSIAIYICVEGFKGPKSSNRNSIISIHSKVMAFLVISLSPWSPHCPHGPHIIPVSFPSSPHCPHSPQKVPMWSPWSVVSVVSTCCPHGLRGLHMLSPSSPRRPHHRHIIPIVPTLSRRCPHHSEPPRHPLHPPPTPLGVGGSESVKIQ